MQQQKIGILVALGMAVACGDGKPSEQNATANNSSNNVSNNSSNNASNNNASNNTVNVLPGPHTFHITLGNSSDLSGHRTALSSAVWALSSSPIVEAGGQPDGLEPFAEEGSPEAFAQTLAANPEITQSGISPNAVVPGESISWEITATPDDGPLQLAAMVVESNDRLVVTTSPMPLFDADGLPLETADISFTYWDAGTEANEVLFMGPHQPPRQEMPNSGSPEGVVRAFDNTTRGLPCAAAMARLSVEESDGTYTISIENGSLFGRQFVSALGTLFFAVHDDRWSLFEPGAVASMHLEALVEEGAPDGLVTAAQGSLGVTKAGRTLGFNSPGQTYSFEVTPDADFRFLTFAASIMRTNDAFVGSVGGIPLINEAGELRPAAEVQTDLNWRIAIYDAGTEANEVPGAGLDQETGGAGAADPDTKIRLYKDSTNDLAGAMAGGLLDVTIVNGASAGEFDVTIANTGATPFQALLGPLAWATHSEPLTFFTPGEAASAELEIMAEDGDPTTLADSFAASNGVGGSGTIGLTIPPIAAGSAFQFTITADAANRWLTFAFMLAPSNDTFVAMEGLELVDAVGAPRSDVDIATDVKVSVWDAGTEVNQAAAGGADQWPRGVLGAGPKEGNGRVRDATETTYPLTDPSLLFRMSIEVLP